MQSIDEKAVREMSNPNLEESAKATADLIKGADPVLVRSAFQPTGFLLEEGGPASPGRVLAGPALLDGMFRAGDGPRLGRGAWPRSGAADPRRGAGGRGGDRLVSPPPRRMRTAPDGGGSEPSPGDAGAGNTSRYTRT